MTPDAPLPQRQPGTHLARPLDRPPPYVVRAPASVSRWSVDGSTLLRLLDALKEA